MIDIETVKRLRQGMSDVYEGDDITVDVNDLADLCDAYERLEKQFADIRSAAIYRGSLLEESLIHLEECDAWQLRGSIRKELDRTKTELQPKESAEGE